MLYIPTFTKAFPRFLISIPWSPTSHWTKVQYNIHFHAYRLEPASFFTGGQTTQAQHREFVMKSTIAVFITATLGLASLGVSGAG